MNIPLWILLLASWGFITAIALPIWWIRWALDQDKPTRFRIKRNIFHRKA